MWADAPPEDVEDPFALEASAGEPPVRIEPAEAIVPPHGTASFKVHLTASKATEGADGHYKYQLLAKGRFTEDRAAPVPALEDKAPSAVPLPPEPERDVISSLTVDCVGDCVVPHLVIDKKKNPAMDGNGPGPIFKFTYCAVAKLPDDMGDRTLVCGAGLAGQAGGTQAAGVHSYKVRQVTLSNHDACNVTCRFSTEGPFRIRQIDQAGKHAFRPEKGAPGDSETSRKNFVVGKWETVTVQVEFLPDAVQWAEREVEHKDKGFLIIEYPHEAAEDGDAAPGAERDLQRVSLLATSFRPRISLWPLPAPEQPIGPPRERADEPPWGQPQTVVVDFGYVHVSSSITQQRAIILVNDTGVVARWRLLHVGRKQLQPPKNAGLTVREEEDLKARDDKDAFEFDSCEGEVLGPSKDSLDNRTGKREPYTWPKPVAFQRPLAPGEKEYEPQQIGITFRPKKNELYKSRFRIQVEHGLSIDFFCKGCGSYDEEDDPLPFQES
jgi:hypothetical protein